MPLDGNLVECCGWRQRRGDDRGMEERAVPLLSTVKIENDGVCNGSKATARLRYMVPLDWWLYRGVGTAMDEVIVPIQWKRGYFWHDNFRGVEKEAFEISKEKKQWSARHNRGISTSLLLSLTRDHPPPQIPYCSIDFSLQVFFQYQADGGK